MFKIHDRKRWELFIFGALVAANTAALIMMYVMPEGEVVWVAYQEKHHCVSLAKMQDSRVSGWHCVDGKIHHRWWQKK